MGGAGLALSQGTGKTLPGEQTCLVFPSHFRPRGPPAIGGGWDGESREVCDLDIARVVGFGKAPWGQNPPQHLSLLPVWQALAKTYHLLVGCHPQSHRPQQKMSAPRARLLQDRPPARPPRPGPVPPFIRKAFDAGGSTISTPTRSQVGGLLGQGGLASGSSWLRLGVQVEGRPLAASACKDATGAVRKAVFLGLA